MRVVVAPDKFKGSLTAPEAAAAIARGVRAAEPTAEVVEVPMADGGEGTVEALVHATGGRFVRTTVPGPRLDAVIDATYGVLGDGRTAVLEMAAASGLGLIEPSGRDPFAATTVGTGELIGHVLNWNEGVRRIVLGIGGSATNDGGSGMATVLGYRLLDAGGREIDLGAGPLERLDRIDASGRDRRLDEVEVVVACDVDNPLLGPRGASAVFGPQKFDPARPARAEDIDRLDRALARLAAVIRRDLGRDVADVPGAGAAGGLGAGLLAFAGARLERGIDLVIEAVGLADRLEGADLCLTGEGSLDAQTASGKTVAGVGRLARSKGVPAIALAGSIGEGATAIHGAGIAAFASICPGPLSLDEAIRDADRLLAAAAEQAVRAFRAGRGPRDG